MFKLEYFSGLASLGSTLPLAISRIGNSIEKFLGKRFSMWKASIDMFQWWSWKTFIETQGPDIDTVYYLQGYKEGWQDGKFEEKWDFRDCLDNPKYKKIVGKNIKGPFWDFEEISAKDFKCVRFRERRKWPKDSSISTTNQIPYFWIVPNPYFMIGSGWRILGDSKSNEIRQTFDGYRRWVPKGGFGFGRYPGWN